MTNDELDMLESMKALCAALRRELVEARHIAMHYARQVDEVGAERDAAQAEARELRRQYAELFDRTHGTPCAQIRWEQERDKLTELADKYKWQVRDTCSRAEKAEAEARKLRELLREAREAFDKLGCALHNDGSVMANECWQMNARIDAALAKKEEGNE